MEATVKNGVVSRPQFDTDYFNVGAAVALQGKQLRAIRNNYVRNALIKAASPLQLEVIYINGDQDDESLNINIDAVVSGEIIIEKLGGK